MMPIIWDVDVLFPQYNVFRDDLLDAFQPGEIDVTGEGTRTSTGKFEVTVNGKLVHSKMNGDGFVDRREKFEKIVTAIKAAM
ncbi:hypothetical protein BsWGS_15114 [Bradybaena similaris]